jgi:hypothetical protein
MVRAPQRPDSDDERWTTRIDPTRVGIGTGYKWTIIDNKTKKSVKSGTAKSRKQAEDDLGKALFDLD